MYYYTFNSPNTQYITITNNKLNMAPKRVMTTTTTKEASKPKISIKTRGKAAGAAQVVDTFSSSSDNDDKDIDLKINKLSKMVEDLQAIVSTMATTKNRTKAKKDVTKLAMRRFYHDHKEAEEVMIALESCGVEKIEKEKKERIGLIERTVTTSSYAWHDVKKATDELFWKAPEETRKKYIDEAQALIAEDA